MCITLQTTYVVQRKTRAPAASTHRIPSLRARHRVYETISDNKKVPQKMNVLLQKYVEGK